MNERFKELAELVGAGTPQSLYGRTDYIVMTEFELEIFAELIVRECVNVNYNSSFKDGEFCARELLEHFGIEE